MYPTIVRAADAAFSHQRDAPPQACLAVEARAAVSLHAGSRMSSGLEATEPRTYTALSKCHKVSRTTLWNRTYGQPSIEEKAKSQQYRTPAEEKALAKYLIRMSNIGYPVRVMYIPSLAFIIARRRSTTDVPIKPPCKNWHNAFEKRHPELNSRKVKAVDWKRHVNNIYDKITHWFEVIGKYYKVPPLCRRMSTIWMRRESCYACSAPSKSL